MTDQSDRDAAPGGKHYLQRELDELMRMDESLHQLLQNQLLDGVWYWDLERPEHEWMNRGFWELLGFDPGEKQHLASEWQDLIFEEDLQVALDNFHKHCEDPNHPYDQVVRYRHRDGSTVWVRCWGVAVRDEAGKPRRMLGMHTDLTELMRTRAQLEQQIQATEAANRQLSQFAYAASHDLQTPLYTISGLLESLFDRNDMALSDSQQEIVDHIKGAADRLRQMVSGLLEFSRVANAELLFKEVDCQRLLEEVKLDLAGDIRQRQASIECDSMPAVWADRLLLRQVFQNLIGNALKFQREGVAPRIVIRSSDDAWHWHFSVSDNGIGIDDKFREEVFKPFKRLHKRGNYEGIGLGLSLCRRAVEAHGGELQLQSVPGEGSTFTFSLAKPEKSESVQ